MSLHAIQNVLSMFYSYLSLWLMMLNFSLSTIILATTIWSLVFHFINFRVYLTIVKGVILILKHATALRLSDEPEKALILAEQDYQEARIDLKIQEYLKAFTPEDSVEQFADFIMATNIGLFMHSSIITMSHLNLQPKLLWCNVTKIWALISFYLLFPTYLLTHCLPYSLPFPIVSIVCDS